MIHLLTVLLSISAASVECGGIDWWHSAVIYQIYPRSFKDSDGDGVGDLRGIIDSVDYLKSLGVGAVWLSPIYPSPNKDFGYDVSDYQSINPEYGTMDDFNELSNSLKKAGIKLIMDFVPNHSSDKHKWFEASVNRTSGYEDFYVWQDPIDLGNGTHGPPNNWASCFDGSAWEYNDVRKQYYLHQFLKEQPDLNYFNSDVLDNMTNVLSFWMDKGVYGFRMDAVSKIWEDRSFNNESVLCPDITQYNCLDHKRTSDQDQTYSVLKNFRQRLDTYSQRDNVTRLLIVEAFSNDWPSLMRYYSVAHFPFNFHLIFDLKISDGAQAWFNTITEWLQNVGSNWSNWVLGNHDQRRAASRLGPELTDAMNMMVLLLKGTAVTYNGEEIGMLDSFVRWDQAQDTQGKAGGPVEFAAKSRDPQRGPMLWNSHLNAGFTSGNKTWLPVHPNYVCTNVEAQRNSDRSHLTVYKRMVKLRQSYVWKFGRCLFLQLTNNTLGIIRESVDTPTIVAMVNFGRFEDEVNLQRLRSSMPLQVYVYAQSGNFDEDMTGRPISSSQVKLPPKGGIVAFSQPLDVPIKADNTMVKPSSWL